MIFSANEHLHGSRGMSQGVVFELIPKITGENEQFPFSADKIMQVHRFEKAG